jgi:hypothetical protein
VEYDALISKAIVMATSRAIQISVSQIVYGIICGAAIEAVLPSPTDGASIQQQVFETLVQTALNGVAVALLPASLRIDDPTFGIPFSIGLAESQPELAARIRSLAAVAKAQVARGVQQTVPHIPAV